MSEPIGPGDWVECIDATPGVNPPNVSYLVLGALYCIEAVITSPRGAVIYGLVGMHQTGLSGRRLAYSAWRFRPIRDGQERIAKKERVSA